MRSARLSLLAVAVPAFAAGLLVLHIGGVGKAIWLVHVAALGLTCLLALLVRAPRGSAGLYAVCGLTLAGVAATLLGPATAPERWLRVGPFSVYMAPLLLPCLLGACATLRRHGPNGVDVGLAALTLVGILLALQPDASQVLALLGATVVLSAIGRGDGRRQWIGVAALVLATLWAFSRPDPLEPVPYVEGVFALAFGHSLVAGAAVLAAAAGFLVGLGWWARRHAAWVLAVSAYYGVLFACSVAGLTPAPLIGYGAGPLLGFGLMVAMASSTAVQGRVDHSTPATGRQRTAP